MEELKAGFPLKEKKALREALQPLLVRGLIWELRLRLWTRPAPAALLST